MYAVIQTGGKQYRVSPGDIIMVERLSGKVGDQVSFDKVLLTSDGSNVNLGKPYLEDSSVTAQITRHGKEKKIVVFKYKRRKDYRRRHGHRQEFSLVKVEDIKF